MLENVLQYWWLIFPIGGVVAGGFRGFRSWVDSRSAIKHKQRLELLAAKKQLREIEIRAGIPAAPAGARVTAKDIEQSWRSITAEHDDITARWLEYELDVAKVITYPAMSDGRQPLTAAFLRAKRTADALRPHSATGLTQDQLGSYREAVVDYGVKFDMAEQDAQRLRDSTFTEQERRRLERAQQLLKTAVDDAATSAERQLAYKRVREELDGLIVLSPDAVTILEKKVGRELPRGNA